MVQLIFEITWNCPCRCPFCPVPKINKILPLTDYKRILQLFKQHYSDRDYAVVLSGGEPGTVPSLKDYVDAARELGYEVTIVTNAFNIENILNSSPDLIELSIDYFGERHDDARGVKGLFSNALRLLTLATEMKIPVVIRSTLMKDNIRDILELRSLLDLNGFNETPIIAMPVRGAPELRPSQQQIEELAEHKGIFISDNCPAGISSFVITPDRDVLACIFYRKKLGQFKKFTKKELDEILKEGAKIPRYPCENPTYNGIPS